MTFNATDMDFLGKIRDELTCLGYLESCDDDDDDDYGGTVPTSEFIIN
jgi:hypothetical protein